MPLNTLSSRASRIAVIGAGITGITSAYALMMRGYDVTIIDRHRYAAMETSFANGGQLSASNAEVWNRLGTVLKGLRWMLDRNAPLLVSPKPSWHKLSWMAEFIANIPNYERNTVETARLAIAARKHLLGMAADEGIAFDREQRGILHVYKNEQEFAHAKRVTKLLGQAGLHREPVTPLDIATLEPALCDDFLGGFFTPSDFTGDIHKYTVGLAQACERRGARFLNETDVSQLKHDTNGVSIFMETKEEVHSERFDKVLICAGVGSRAMAKALGDQVNVYPVKGYSVTVHLDDHQSRSAAPTVSILDDEAKIVTSRLGADRFRIAGTAEFNGYNRDIRADRIQPLVRWCEQNFPGVSTETVTPWAGLRPMMPNMMPRVGAGRKPGVYYNTGHGHLGWTLSAITAEMVAEAMLADDRRAQPKAIKGKRFSPMRAGERAHG